MIPLEAGEAQGFLRELDTPFVCRKGLASLCLLPVWPPGRQALFI